ncbi:hypothetical protein EC968_004815 [Mortierella alpina]|nr:hypothetical protein EC968_004815 [Mortierella alpina]
MYNVKPQALAAARRARNPTLLVASTVAAVASGAAFSRPVHCQHESAIQAKAEDLKEHVQEFTDHVLEMAESPYDSKSSLSAPPTSSSSQGPASSYTSGRDRGHGSRFFSLGQRSGGEQHHSQEANSHQHYFGAPRDKMSKFRGAYVEEPLIPALFYVAVAGLTGSIIARKSNIVFRFLSPVALAMGASAYCIPKTTNNVIYGLRTFDYQAWSSEWQNKYHHAKQSVVDTTHGLTAAAGSVAHGAKDVAHDLSDKTHELTDKTQKVLKDVKEKTVEAAHDIKDKGTEVVNEVKHKSKDMGHQLEHTKDQLKNKVEDKAGDAKHWWEAETKKAERTAKDFASNLKPDEARKWASRAKDDTQDWFREKQQRARRMDGDDVERGFDRFKNKARQSWDSARDEIQDRGREWRREGESMKDHARDWAQDRSRDMRGRFEDWKERGQDWANDRGQEGREMGREAGRHWDDFRQEARRQGQEARDFSEDRYRDAKRDIRNRAEDMQDHGRRQARKFEREFNDMRSRSRSSDRTGAAAGGLGGGWGFGRPGEDDGGRRGRFDEREEYAGRRGYSGDRFDHGPRRSVTEAAKEGKSWWHKNASDPYEYYDNSNRSGASSWWKAGSSATKDDVRDQFEHAKHQAQRGADRFKDSVEDRAEAGRSWFADKTNEMKHKFEHGKHQAEQELHSKFARPHGAAYRDEQGRDYYGRMGRGMGHNHASIYSQDNWFHYDHGEDNRASRGRARERGM